MKIPFFYLDLGHIQIFQPQNQPLDLDNKLAISDDEELSIEHYNCPEIAGNTLYLNGDEGNFSHSFCINVENDRTPYMTELIELLETIEV